MTVRYSHLPDSHPRIVAVTMQLAATVFGVVNAAAVEKEDCSSAMCPVSVGSLVLTFEF